MLLPFIVADVITTFYLFSFWLMLLPMFVADVIATEADVIACNNSFLADVIANFICGRCYFH